MKHVFVINPTAGTKNITKKLIEKIYTVLNKDDCDIYITKAHLDAKKYVKEYCENHSTEEIRFYSCGGDGTLNEVVNGAYGYPNVSIACYPCGSGNDFVKYFGKKDDFLIIEKLVNGKTVEVDLIKLNDRFVINVFNLGFDANVAERMIKYKRIPFVTGKGAYILGIMVSFFHKITTEMEVIVDDTIVYQGNGVLAAVSNAICYGGGFYCSPKAKVDDGLLDVVAVKKVSRSKFLKFIKYYKAGTHLDEPRLKDYIVYNQGKKVRIITKKPVNYAIDGEMGKSNDITLTIHPKAIKFVTI